MQSSLRLCRTALSDLAQIIGCEIPISAEDQQRRGRRRQDIRQTRIADHIRDKAKRFKLGIGREPKLNLPELRLGQVKEVAGDKPAESGNMHLSIISKMTARPVGPTCKCQCCPI